MVAAGAGAGGETGEDDKTGTGRGGAGDATAGDATAGDVVLRAGRAVVPRVVVRRGAVRRGGACAGGVGDGQFGAAGLAAGLLARGGVGQSEGLQAAGTVEPDHRLPQGIMGMGALSHHARLTTTPAATPTTQMAVDSASTAPPPGARPAAGVDDPAAAHEQRRDSERHRADHRREHGPREQDKLPRDVGRRGLRRRGSGGRFPGGFVPGFRRAMRNLGGHGLFTVRVERVHLRAAVRGAPAVFGPALGVKRQPARGARRHVFAFGHRRLADAANFTGRLGGVAVVGVGPDQRPGESGLVDRLGGLLVVEGVERVARRPRDRRRPGDVQRRAAVPALAEPPRHRSRHPDRAPQWQEKRIPDPGVPGRVPSGATSNGSSPGGSSDAVENRSVAGPTPISSPSWSTTRSLITAPLRVVPVRLRASAR